MDYRASQGFNSSLSLQAVAPADRDKLLAWHNKIRCLHQVDELSWSDKLAEFVAHWHQNGAAPGEEDPDRNTGRAMQTLMQPTADNYFWSAEPINTSLAMQVWYAPSQQCAGGPTQFQDGCPTGALTFAAMVWSSVKYFGCAASDKHDPYLLICRYYAGPYREGHDAEVPVMKGFFAEQVFPRRTISCDEECPPAEIQIKDIEAMFNTEAVRFGSKTDKSVTQDESPKL